MKQLTVFTPTYNRAYCLGQCYESLKRQTNKNFIWLLIDDGSSDNTKELVKQWQKENVVEIQYQYQKNQGMHGAHNTAYKYITTELNVCIDSDDFMPDTAVADILMFWNSKTVQEQESVAGIIALDGNKKGEVLGKPIPEHILKTTLYDLYEVHKAFGDKKLIYRTAVVKEYPPYPLFKGERFVPLGYKYLLIDQDYVLYTLNKIVCIVEYMPDGSSLNILKQYRKNPRGFAFSRIAEMQYGKTFKYRFKKAIHFVSSNLFFNNINIFKEAPNKLLVFLALVPGVFLYFYIKLKTKNS